MNPVKLKTMRILWGALFASTLLYLGAVLAIQKDQHRLPGSPIMPPVLAALAVGFAAASIAVPRSMVRTALRQKELRVAEVPEDQRLFADRKGRARHFVDPEGARSEAFPALQSAFIVGMALAEAIALFGFVLLFLGFKLTWGLPFFAVCWVLMLGRFPSEAKLDQQIEEVYDADLSALPNEGAR